VAQSCSVVSSILLFPDGGTILLYCFKHLAVSSLYYSEK